MELHREISITEGQGPVPVRLTLDEIINAGKVTNPYQIFVLSWLSEFFKDGPLTGSLEVGNPTTFMDATKTANIEIFKSMSPADQVALAEYLKACVAGSENHLANSGDVFGSILRHARVQR